jgi:two-component system response regulator AtoC
MELLFSYSWPGNVRELENAMERAVLLSEDAVLMPEHFPLELRKRAKEGGQTKFLESLSLKDAQKSLEKKLITQALRETRGNRSHAARLLEISHPSLLSKIKSYDIAL